MNATVTFNPAQITLVARDFEQISVGAASTPLDATKAANCWRAVLKVEGGGTCRFRIDGGVPTALVGTLLFDGEQIELSHSDAIAFRAFRVDAVNPTLDVIYMWP